MLECVCSGCKEYSTLVYCIGSRNFLKIYSMAV